eukprot:snap_masked-scaffold_29-processed-gene-4.33-mRNA-1 protein AED:1.00 eAED:1.00 QI:0/0/0/0/1/1/2/0/64
MILMNSLIPIILLNLNSLRGLIHYYKLLWRYLLPAAALRAGLVFKISEGLVCIKEYELMYIHML